MTEHVGLDVMAALGEGLLDPREAKQARLHVRRCSTCAARQSALHEVPAALRTIGEADPPPVPAWVAERLDAALAAEAGSNGRALSHPLPDHVPSIAARRRRRLRGPRPDSRLARPLAAAAAICVLAGGGYAAFRAATPAPRSAPAAITHSPPTRVNPLIPRGTIAAPTSPAVVHSGINYQPGQLQAQVESVLQTSRHGHSGGSGAPMPASVHGCVQRAIGQQEPTLVDEARYRGRPATVIVTPEANGPGGQVWIEGAGCSAARTALLAQTSITSIP